MLPLKFGPTGETVQTMQTSQQENYYDILDLDRTASQGDIKRAFRRLAKEYHPDTTQDANKEAASRQLKRVMAAYRVLSNERERARYDVLLQTQLSSTAKETADDRSVREMAGNVLEHLLEGEGDDALEVYDELTDTEDFELRDHFSMRDYLDCLFLLAEEMEEVSRDREAAALYEELYEREKEPPRHRYFFEEVKVRLKKLYSRKLPRGAESPVEEIQCYERILQFDVDRSEKAFILKKIAEVHLKVGETEKAKKVFQEALDLKPGLKGTATIRERLGFDPA